MNRDGKTHLDTLVAAETVQLVQEFQHCPLHLTVTTLLGVKSFGTNSIQLINEDNSWRLLFGELEGIPDQLRTIANEHLH